MDPDVLLLEIGCGRPELNEPLGICTIASYLASTNHVDPGTIALAWDRLPGWKIDRFPLHGVRLIGISAQINSLSRTRAIYAQLRHMLPRSTIVLGNLLAIYASDALLEEFPDAILCTGEGEATFAEIHSLIANQADGTLDRAFLKQVSNLLYLQDGERIRTGTRLIPLEHIPPPRRDFTADLVAAGGITRVEASRGCHWGRCEFCSAASRFGLGGYRRFTTERIIQDLAQLGTQGALSPYFSDEDFFGARYDESSKLADAIISAKASGTIPPAMNFFVSILASDVKRPEGLAALLRWKDAGLREVFVGVEAGADEEIRRFAKKANAQTNTNAVETLLKMGFQVDIGFIMFDPMMSLEDLEQNLRWLGSHDLGDVDSRVTKRLRIQPKTGLESKYERFIEGPLDVDELTYPNGFADPRVAAIERDFRYFEGLAKQATYSLLGAGRGEVDEQFRLERKRRLALIRDIDLEYLQALVDHERGLRPDVAPLRDALLANKLERMA